MDTRNQIGVLAELPFQPQTFKDLVRLKDSGMEILFEGSVCFLKWGLNLDLTHLGKYVTTGLHFQVGHGGIGEGIFQVPKRSSWYQFVSPCLSPPSTLAFSGLGYSDVTSCSSASN